MSPTATVSQPLSRLIDPIRRSSSKWILLILLSLIAIFTVLSPQHSFLTVTNFQAIGEDTAELLLLAAGMTFIMIAGGIDLSCGAFVVFTAVIAAEVMGKMSSTPTQAENLVFPHLARGMVLGVVAALACGTAWGWLNGYITVRWRVPPFIVTLGTLGMSLGAAELITGGLNVPSVPPQLQNSFGVATVFGIPMLVIVVAVMIAVLWIVLHETRFGLRTYAIGSNIEAARRAGVNVGRHQILLYTLMGLLAGVVGVLDVARFDTASISSHTTDNLQAIAAAAIGGVSLYGGVGRMSGTVIGALIPAVLTSGFVIVGMQPYWQQVAVGIVLIVAVYIDQARRRQNFQQSALEELEEMTEEEMGDASQVRGEEAALISAQSEERSAT